MRKIMSKFLEVGEKSYYVWKNKNHPILVSFLEKYFTASDLQEFIDTGRMSKLEKASQKQINSDLKMKAIYAVRWVITNSWKNSDFLQSLADSIRDAKNEKDVANIQVGRTVRFCDLLTEDEINAICAAKDTIADMLTSTQNIL